MKRTSLIIALLLLSCLMLLTSCKGEEDNASFSGETKTLNVYNWGEYISDGSLGTLDSNAAFEDYFNENLAQKYGYYIKDNYTTYATNEDMFSKLSSGAGTYDVVVPSDYMIEQMIESDMLYEFDVTELANYSNILDEFKGLYYDPSNMYSVPYTYGMTGVIYNTALVDPEDYESQSWELLWNEKYKGKILQFNNPRDAFGSAMYAMHLDINSTDKAVWDAALQKLAAQKPLVQGYVNDEIFNKMTTASAAIAPYFAGDFVTMSAQNEDLAFYYPKEGTNYFIDAMCIPKDSKMVDAAKEYINFMLSEEPAVANAIYIGYASPNKLVQESETYREDMGEDALDILYGTTPDAINEEYLKLYDTACYRSLSVIGMQDYVSSLWESLKTENSTELWVHVTCIVIVVGVLSLAIYNTYIRKKRSKDYRTRDKLIAKQRKQKA